MHQGCWSHVWSHQVRLTCYVGRRTLGPLSPDTNTVREETDHFGATTLFSDSQQFAYGRSKQRVTVRFVIKRRTSSAR